MGNLNSRTGDGLILTQNEIDVAKRTWNIMLKHNLRDLGNGLMARTTIEHKEIKQLWRRKAYLNEKQLTDDICMEEDIALNQNQLIKAHGEKVFHVITMAINSLEDLEGIARKLNEMGYQHFKYGTRIEHLEFIGDALISTISDTLKEDFTDSVEKVWLKLFSIIEYQMKLGMNQAQLTE